MKTSTQSSILAAVLLILVGTASCQPTQNGTKPIDNIDPVVTQPAATQPVTAKATEAPTAPPTAAPTAAPTAPPTAPPTEAPTAPPTEAATAPPTEAPTAPPTKAPTNPPTEPPTEAPATKAAAIKLITEAAPEKPATGDAAKKPTDEKVSSPKKTNPVPTPGQWTTKIHFKKEEKVSALTIGMIVIGSILAMMLMTFIYVFIDLKYCDKTPPADEEEPLQEVVEKV